MLPLEASMSVSPGLISLLCSACSIMRFAMRSFTEPPGLQYSSFAKTVALTSSDWGIRLRRASCVPPTRSATELTGRSVDAVDSLFQ